MSPTANDIPAEPPPSGERRRSILYRRRVAVTAGIVVAALVVGARGFALAGGDDGGESTSEPSEQAERTPEEAGLAFARCMREQGIDDWPEPQIDPDGSIFFEGITEISASTEQIDAADAVCAPILDTAEPASGGQQEAEPETVEPGAAGWERIVPEGDCRCADGSDYAYYARDASPTKVVLYLRGGGACWSAETCDPQGSNEYRRSAEGQAPDGEGIFALEDERNPLADHSFVFAPYCTGDIHLGNATTEYTPDRTIHHKGAVNGAAALDYLATTYPNATEGVVIGASAGAVSSPLYAGMVSDRLPDAKVTVIADSAGAYADVPELNAIVTGDAWGAGRGLPDWFDAGSMTAPGLFVETARHDPDIVLARFDHAYDEVQESMIAHAGVPVDDLLTLIDAKDAQMEEAGVDVVSYTAPGDQHTGLSDDSFYGQNVAGVALVDWVTRIVAGEPVEDVRCTECTTG